MSHQGTSIDVILTNKPRSFLKSLPIETGLSDHHRLVITFLRSHISYKLRAKNIVYRETNKINEDIFMLRIFSSKTYRDFLTLILVLSLFLSL